MKLGISNGGQSMIVMRDIREDHSNFASFYPILFCSYLHFCYSLNSMYYFNIWMNVKRILQRIRFITIKKNFLYFHRTFCHISLAIIVCYFDLIRNYYTIVFVIMSNNRGKQVKNLYLMNKRLPVRAGEVF